MSWPTDGKPRFVVSMIRGGADRARRCAAVGSKLTRVVRFRPWLLPSRRVLNSGRP